MVLFFQKSTLSTSVSCYELALVSLGTSLNLSFLLCMMGISVEPISQGWCEDLKTIYIQYLMLGLAHSRCLINADIFMVIILTVMVAVCP